MAGDAPDIPIDPQLLNGGISRAQIPTSDILKPTTDNQGRVLTTRESFKAQVEAVRTKQPLRDALISAVQLASVPKGWNLERLRATLVNHWYPTSETSVPGRVTSLTNIPPHDPCEYPLLTINNDEELPLLITPRNPSPQQPPIIASLDSIDDEVSLVNEFGLSIDGAEAHKVLGYGDDDDEDNDDVNGEVDDLGEGEDNTESFQSYQTQLRVSAVLRAEGNRRQGGLKTQKAVVCAWEEFRTLARFEGRIQDDIVDEHSLLSFIQYSAERPKRTRRGHPIPGTFVGASHLKKLFFGALRICKEQDALDPSLATCGLVPGEDAPDITANTFLAEITPEQLEAVAKGFLMHRELCSVVYGHLAWTSQHSSGNRGDDLRALKLAELQPWTMTHPNQETKIQCLLALQSEEKAGKRGMRTVINPVYTVWMAHRSADLCPIGAFAIYHHYLHDVKQLASSEDIDWTVNKSWRQVRVLCGPKSPTTPFSDQSLYNLYVRAFEKANFTSRIKAHLPRHLLGFKQEEMGVDPNDTSQLGWVRGQTYFDTYRPSIAKAAVLAAHGYKTHEIYNPAWRQVRVPEQFLLLVCPMAEEIYEKVAGGANLNGAANYWKLVIQLRPYLFQCGAVLYERCPQSAIFRLPAFAHQDVRNWMLIALQAQEGSPIDRQRLENTILQQSLEDLRSIVSRQNLELARLPVMSLTQGFSMDRYSGEASKSGSVNAVPSTPPASVPNPFSQHRRDASGVYTAADTTLRAFVNASPPSSHVLREPTQVDLVLPPVEAFSDPGAARLIWPPCLGQKSVRWVDVFKLIKQPQLCWESWKPAKTLAQYETVSELWDIFTSGEPVYHNGIQTGVRPPLRDVEQYFQHRWRTKGASNQKKAWERFREIPEYIDNQSTSRGISPAVQSILAFEQRRPDSQGRLKAHKIAEIITLQRRTGPMSISTLSGRLVEDHRAKIEGSQRRLALLSPQSQRKVCRHSPPSLTHTRWWDHIP
ncbi:hypothetical protein BDN71DRAFT_1490630 [Pleurotus eryngii]|uniref:Ndc10 domain-containing protein n=1 Tax=Pleurotus eryngii TaxID=5323 RepID=A0A9P6D2W4_PLEER|nr:hypothetical protein BDN71DRAFT_1490630 [Pleurotus eryngii]